MIKTKTLKEKRSLTVILVMVLTALIGLFFIEPISQDCSYHNFADEREIFSIANFWNVISNLPYLLIGGYALYKLVYLNSLVILNESKLAYILFFVGVSAVAFGSAYYHLNPSNETLLWDRLPMTIAFMALFSFVISEFLSLRLGKNLLFPLLLMGLSSVIYWFFSELRGEGDLRFYALVQFLPMLIMPIFFLFFRSTFSLVKGYWLLLLCYLLAKVFEQYDIEIYHFLGFISGHSLKHIVSALGVYILLITFEQREVKKTLKVHQ
jgi:hypothetical protein